MQAIAERIKTLVPEVPVHFVPATDPFRPIR